MMTSRHIVDVSESDFEFEVIAHSQAVPVVVDFWAEWCGPCHMLGPILERLAEEADGDFRLAKVDVDESPNLAMRFNVQGIPAVKAFRNGQVVAEFTGAQPEPSVREFLRKVCPSVSDLRLEKGQSLLQMEQWSEAEEAFREALDARPENPAALLGLAKSMLAQGRSQEAADILRHFPDSREFGAAEALLPLAKALLRLDGKSNEVDDFLQAAYERALRLIGLGNFPAAMDGLLDVLKKDKRYGDDEARKVMLALFEILGDQSDLTRQYRAELASVLF